MIRIKVLLVDDHTLLRQGLRALLENYEDIEVIGDAQTGEEALTRVRELVPDVVLMDIAMPGMNGLEATRKIRELYPQVRVLILTQLEDRHLVLSLLQAGASGYVLKRALGSDVATAIRAVYQGGTFLDQDVTMRVVDEAFQHDASEEVPLQALTARECEILTHISLGKTNSQIARVLSISINTVVWHRANLMGKLGLHKATDLVRYAIQHGLIEETVPKAGP
jgi:DNA-binding NarL/FixJ family response regulator